MDTSNIGKRVKERREAKRLTLRQLSDKSGCGYQELERAGSLEENEGWRKGGDADKSLIVDLLSLHPDMTYQEIGEIVGCTRQRAHAVARKAGLTRKSRLYRDDVTVERVLELYYRSNLLVKDIAGIFGCHSNTITGRLRVAGIRPSESYSRRQKLYWRRVKEATRVVAKS